KFVERACSATYNRAARMWGCEPLRKCAKKGGVVDSRAMRATSRANALPSVASAPRCTSNFSLKRLLIVMRTHLLATVLTALLLPLPDGFAEDAGTFSADDYRAVALQGGDAQRGEQVFRSQEAACAKCHAVGGDERRAGPNLSTIGDKY